MGQFRRWPDPRQSRALAVARGDEPADLLITGGRVFADATREWVDTSLAIADGVIAGGATATRARPSTSGGAALTPGFVDAHMHLESTKLWIDEFVPTVLPLRDDGGRRRPARAGQRARGAGIAGADGGGRAAAVHFGVYASSCVPASAFERSGATLDAATSAS